MEIFPYIQRMKKEKPYQLFCFPHAGGNSLTFAKWVDRSSKIDIIPISLSERGKENNYNNLVGIIAEKIIAILDDRPFFFWGHSMGAALAFSVSYYIEKKYNYFPEKLIVAARQPPYIVKSFFLENQRFFSVSSINISEEGAIGMDISLYLVRK